MQRTLRAERERRGWTLSRLAERAGVHKSTVSRLEAGETAPTYTTVVALESALGLKRGTLEFHEATQ